MNIDEIILRVMYNPLSYIHPEYVTEHLSSDLIINETFVNYWIIEHFQLSNPPDDWYPDDIISELLLLHWDFLPEICQLLGGYLSRHHLLKNPSFLLTNTMLLSFISLPLLVDVKIHADMDQLTIDRIGVAFLSSLSSGLQSGLQQRIPLHFSPSADVFNLSVSLTPGNINLLKMAAIYAKNSK